MKVESLTKNTQRAILALGVLCLFLILFFNQMLLCKEIFELTPIKINFNGYVVSKNNIIVYGDNGTYLLSNDKGKSWSQRRLNSFKNILDVKNFQDTLWGILEGNYFIVSYDGGLDWEIYKIDFSDDEFVSRLLIDDNYIFLRGRKTIYKLDRNLRIVSSITSDTLQINLNDYYYYTQDFPSRSFLNVNNSHLQFFLFNNKILVNVEKLLEGDKTKNNKVVIVDKELTKIEPLKLSERIPFKVDSLLLIIDWIGKYKGKDVVSVSNHLFFVDSTLENFSYFFKNQSFMNYVTPTGKLNTSLPTNFFGVNWKTLFIYSDVLYGIFTQNKDNNNPINKFILKRYFDGDGSDTFLTIGNYFLDIYQYSYFYRKSSQDSGSFTRFDGIFYPFVYSTFSFQTPPLCFDSVLVFPWLRKFLIVSTNLGNSWKLVTALSGKPKYILSDTFLVFTNEIPIACDINTSRDCVFWSPLIYYDSLTGKKSSTFSNLYDLQIFYLDSTGFGFATGNADYGYQNFGGFFMVTYDFWKTFQIRASNYLTSQLGTGQKPRVISNLCRLGDSILFVLNDTSRSRKDFYINQVWIGDTNLSKIFLYGDTSYSGLFTYPFDTTSLMAVIYIMPKNISEFDAICLVNDSLDIKKVLFEIRRIYDKGRKWITLHRLEDFGQINQIFELNKDTIFIAFKYPDKICLYDRIHNKLQWIWEPKTSGLNPLLMVISDRFYIVGRGLFLENTDRSDLTQWRQGEWDYGKPNFESVIFKGNVAIAGLSDSLRPFNYYK
ncbi:MAG: hypothetical protein ACP5LT_10100, partial [Candidatus Kapaibacteriota bacterium]